MKSKKTGQAKDLDQFYTNPSIAKDCIDLVIKHVPEENRKYFIEPSCGTGSFSLQLKNCVAVDLDPKIQGAMKADFLNIQKEDLFPKMSSKEICVIGNPPFGKNSSLAVKFFNHAAKFGDVIAFIVPRTFRKVSLQNKLDLNFWLVLDVDLPKESFIYEGEAYTVPCCFQIWVKKTEKRQVIKSESLPFLSFTTKTDCDFAVRRVGGKTGKAYIDFKDCAEVSHYFLKVTDPKISVKEIVGIINSIDFSKEANSTAGVKSISKGEFQDAVRIAMNLK